MRERKRARPSGEELVREQAARAEAEAVARPPAGRSSALTDAALAPLDLDELLRRAAGAHRDVLGVDGAAVLLRRGRRGHAIVVPVGGRGRGGARGALAAARGRLRRARRLREGAAGGRSTTPRAERELGDHPLGASGHLAARRAAAASATGRSARCRSARSSRGASATRTSTCSQLAGRPRRAGHRARAALRARAARSPRSCSAACCPPSCRAVPGPRGWPRATCPAARAPRSAATGTTRSPLPGGRLAARHGRRRRARRAAPRR